jgi:hypothetical protein
VSAGGDVDLGPALPLRVSIPDAPKWTDSFSIAADTDGPCWVSVGGHARVSKRREFVFSEFLEQPIAPGTVDISIRCFRGDSMTSLTTTGKIGRAMRDRGARDLVFSEIPQTYLSP